MKRRFKSKKKIRFKSIFVFVLAIAVTLFSFCIIKRLDPLFLLTQDYRLFTINFNRNDFLLKSGFKMLNEVEEEKPVFNDTTTEEVVVRKKIYVYNTHQKEEYADFDVLSAAKKLKSELYNYGIDVIVEETNITDEVKKNNYTYSQSYRVTKSLMSAHLDEGISLFIDLHRDSSEKNITTASIDGINYAKMMFVVGGSHENYMNNYRVSEEINKMLKNRSPSISRGLLLRKNSSFNQEVDSRVILIELGGPYNTKEEVENSLKVLAGSIYDYLEE